MTLRNIFLALVLFCTSCQTNQSSKKIALFLPMTHQALEDITKGFEDHFTTQYPEKAEITIFNAMGNQLLLKTQIEQAVQSGYDLFVPVGTQVTQMALSLCPHQKIVYLAADKKQLQNADIYGVQDEIPLTNHIELFQSKNIKKVTLIYSPSDKIFPEVAALRILASNAEITLQELFVQKTRDLFSIQALIDSDSEALFILKDHIVVSGIEALVQIQNEQNIPLLASDEGSVKRGAQLALGVSEADIGKKGAMLAVNLLLNIPCEKEICIDKPTLFTCIPNKELALEASDFPGFSEIFDDFVDESGKDETPHTTYSKGVTNFPIDQQKGKNFASHRKTGAPL